MRAGTGVSFHEFEVALGPCVHERVIATGYEPEILCICPISTEEAILSAYLADQGVAVNEAFARDHLYLILAKPR